MSARKAGVLEDAGDGRDGVLAGRGQIEGELDKCGTVKVNGDCCNLTAVCVLTNVEVADTGYADGAAGEELALQADLDQLAITP